MMNVISALLGAAVAASLTIALVIICQSIGMLEVGERSRLRSPTTLALIIITGAVWLAHTLLYQGGELIPMLSDVLLLVFTAVLALIDLERHIVPNKLLLTMLILRLSLIAVGVIADPASGLEMVGRSLAGALMSGICFLLCYLVSHRQLGGGDVKYAFILGLYLTGERVLAAMLYGVLCCCVYSLVQLCRKKLKLKDGVPLIPFLYIGVLITYLISG